MAVRKFILVAGQSNATPVADAQSWEAANPRIAVRVPFYTGTNIPQHAGGSNEDRYTMPTTFAGGPQTGILGVTDEINGQYQTINTRGNALAWVKFLTFYNAISTYYDFNAYATDYPGRAKIIAESTPTRLNTNLKNQSVRGKSTMVSVTTADPGVFTITGHPFSDGDIVAPTNTTASGLPGGLEAAGSYKIRNATANTFELGEWPHDPDTSIEITSSGSGTTYFQRAERGTITRRRTNTSHTAACGGPTNEQSASNLTLNVDPPFDPPPEIGERFDYTYRSGATGTTTTVKFDTRLGGLFDIGTIGDPANCIARKPTTAGQPARFWCDEDPQYIGRPVQLSPTSNVTAILSVDTVADTVTLSSDAYEDGDLIIASDGAGALPGGLTDGSKYYVYNKSGATVQLTTSRASTTPEVLSAGFSAGSGFDYTLPAPLATATNYYVVRKEDYADFTFTANGTTVNTGANKFVTSDWDQVWDEAVRFSGDDLPGGVVAGQTYYISPKSTAGHWQIHEEIGGSAVTLTSTGSGTVTVERLTYRTAYFISTKYGGKELELTEDGGRNAIQTTTQSRFAGCLSGLKIRCASGTQALIDDGERDLSHVSYDAANDTSIVHIDSNGSPWSTAPAADDTFVITPPKMKSTPDGADEDIEFEEWAYWLNWSPFEGKGDGSYPPLPVTFDLDDEDGIKVSGIGQPQVGAVFRLYSTGRLPDPFKPGRLLYLKAYDDGGCWLGYSNSSDAIIQPTRRTPTASDNASGVITYGTSHGYGHNESIVFEGTDVAGEIGLVAGTVYYVNKQSDTTIKLYDAPDGADVAPDDSTSPAVTSRRADSGTHYAVPFEQDGKYNPFPPGFNYPNHWNIPQIFQPYDGPCYMSRYPKQGVSAGIAARHAEYNQDVCYVHQCAAGGTALGLREISFLTDTRPSMMWFGRNEMTLSWSPADDTRMFGRLKKELDAAKRAAAMDGDTLECEGVYWLQGESDAIWEDSADAYEGNLENFIELVRQTIKDKGMFSGPAHTLRWVMPFINDEHTHTVWTHGTKINAAIAKVAERDAYMRTVALTNPTFMPDEIHYDGAYMATLDDDCFEAWKSMERVGRSEVDVCNLALANIGDSGTVTSINPPLPADSRQATVCAQYYDLALNKVLQRHNWDFALRRTSPTAITTDRTEWLYSYSLPSDFVGVHAVLSKDATDDVSINGSRTTIKYAVEIDSTHTRRLYTNEPDVILRYYAKVKDPTQWTESFVIVLGWQLAAMVAPPLIKGEAGMKAAQHATQMVEFYLPQATSYDARTTRERTDEDDVPDIYRT